MVDGGFRLPDWNDLTNEQRAAICDIGWRWTDYHDGGDIAHGIYTEIRKLVTVQMPPLLALLHTDTTQKAAHGATLNPYCLWGRGMSDDLVNRARDFAIQAHRYQRYGDQPYRVHLGAVVQVLKDFGAVDPHVLAAGWLHDTIEDTGETRMSLATKFGASVARLVYAVSGEGKNRRERNRSIYLKIAEHPAAAVVKCADRIANVEAATPRSRHWNMYANEQPRFERAIKAHVPAPMWARLEAAFDRSIPSNALGAGGT